jgi:proteasome lid subunit RPN8/RPN11
VNRSYFAVTDIWRIPQTVITDVLEEMAIDGSRGNEGIALFLGRHEGTTAEVTHLVKLRGAGIQKHPDQIRITAALLNEVTDVAIENEVCLIGQVHSHGPGHYVDLSPTDRAFGIKTPYYLSLVAPDYAMSEALFQDWGVHVYTENHEYERLPNHEVDRRIQFVSNASLPFLTVGGENGF